MTPPVHSISKSKCPLPVSKSAVVAAGILTIFCAEVAPAVIRPFVVLAVRNGAWSGNAKIMRHAVAVAMSATPVMVMVVW